MPKTSSTYLKGPLNEAIDTYIKKSKPFRNFSRTTSLLLIIIALSSMAIAIAQWSNNDDKYQIQINQQTQVIDSLKIELYTLKTNFDNIRKVKSDTIYLPVGHK